MNTPRSDGRPVVFDVVVLEGGRRNPVRSVIPATLIYLGASPDRDGGRRTMDQAGEKEWAEFVSAALLPLLSKKFRTSDHCSLWGSKVPNWGTALIAHSGALFSSSCVGNFRVHFASSFSSLEPRPGLFRVQTFNKLQMDFFFQRKVMFVCNHYELICH